MSLVSEVVLVSVCEVSILEDVDHLGRDLLGLCSGTAASLQNMVKMLLEVPARHNEDTVLGCSACEVGSVHVMHVLIRRVRSASSGRTLSRSN